MLTVKNGLSNLLIVGCLMFSGISLAEQQNQETEETRNPLGCKDVGYQFELRVLELMPEAVHEAHSIYFMYNKLDTPVNLYQMPEEQSTSSLYMNNRILPQQWGVLSTSEDYVKYICTVDNGQPYGKVVNCRDSIKVCEFANVKYGLNNRGNFWLVKNNSRDGAVRDVTNYGIIPR